jgi:FKBP-type peptidyl-prolyl cis-trans isomerase FklB
MRKAIFYTSLMIVSGILPSCNKFASKTPDLDSKTDSLNYIMGLLYGDQVNYELFTGNAHDEESVKSFFMGMREGFKDDFDEETVFLYMSGANLGINVKTHGVSGIFGDSSVVFDTSFLMRGAMDGLHNKHVQMTPEEAEYYLNTVFEKKQREVFRAEQKRLEKEYKANKEAGEAFLRENAQKDSVFVTESGLQCKILKKGNGPVPQENDIVKIYYKGSLIDGTVFQSSTQGEPLELQANSSIKGWTEAFLQMPTGSKWEIYVPQYLAYGMYSPVEEVEPFSALIYEIELLEIKK